MPTFAHGEHAYYAGKGRYSGTSGVLYLTNRRILFEYEKGRITKHTYISLDIPISSVEGVSVERPRFGLASLVTNLIIITRRGSVGFGLNRIKISDLASPDIWATKIDDAISGEAAAPEANVVVKEEIIKVPCKFCGTLVDPIRDKACPNCGAPPLSQ
ncbi:MAG TPA: hypothetical protein VMS77_01555 [Conexivisphaerales archaeon]|nr:hypothetical protein [Conexivisphaerales archaeon]